MKTHQNIEQVADIIKNAKKTIALTGAGISVESGIATFRGEGGLWEKYNPEEYAHVESFLQNPEKSWIMLREMGEQIFQAKPNQAHLSLTELQKMNKLSTIITQNVDNLHQEAGSKNVIEFHGNYKKLVCLHCKSEFPFEKTRINSIPPPPQCTCGATLKPNVVLFGETPPFHAMRISEEEAMYCDVLLLIGTSAVIYPAANIPFIASNNDAIIIEINTEPSDLTSRITDYFLQGSAGDILNEITTMITDNQK